jgi:hypothetical protein
MRKTIANRKMFRNGGYVNGGPAGILASSPSLIDAVTRDAMDPQGGQTLSMAGGGIVRKMANGGIVGGTVPSMAFGAAPGSRVDPKYIHKLSPAERLQRYAPVEAERYNPETEPFSLANFFKAQTMRPGIIGAPEVKTGLFSKDPTPLETGLGTAFGAIGATIDQAARGLSTIAAEAGDAMYDFGEFLVTPKSKDTSYKNKFTQIREVNSLLERLPTRAQEISSVAKSVLAESPNLTGQELAESIISEMEFEDVNLAVDMGVAGIPDEVEEKVVIDTFAEKGPDAPRQVEPERVDLGEDMREAEEVAQTPQAGTGMGEGDEFEDPNAMKQKGDVGDEIEAAGTPTDAADAAKQVAQTFNKTDMKPEEAKRGMEYYLDRFKKAMPKYEGMSESEKGMLIAEAGLKVMAGQSPNAITNIAEGLKGVSKEFIADEKARRAYDRQVDLSAAKYGFAQLDRDRAEALALAKEGRQMPYQLVANKDFEFEGQKIKKGQAYPLTRAQIDAGLLQKLPLTYRESFMSDVKAALALAKKTAQGREKPGAFTKSRETYLANARSLKNGARMKGLLMEAASIAIPENAAEDSKVLGAVPLLKSWTDKALNAAGYQANTGVLANLRSTEPEKYRTLMKTIGTTMVTEILNESNKTISEGDRARVDDLVAAYADYDGTVASYRSLVVKLKNLEASIDSGIEEAGRSMKGIESTWNNTIFKGGTRARDVLSDMRNFGTPLPTYSVGKRTSAPVYYKDIIDMSTRKFTPKYQKIFKVS